MPARFAICWNAFLRFQKRDSAFARRGNEAIDRLVTLGYADTARLFRPFTVRLQERKRRDDIPHGIGKSDLVDIMHQRTQLGKSRVCGIDAHRHAETSRPYHPRARMFAHCNISRTKGRRQNFSDIIAFVTWWYRAKNGINRRITQRLQKMYFLVIAENIHFTEGCFNARADDVECNHTTELLTLSHAPHAQADRSRERERKRKSITEDNRSILDEDSVEYPMRIQQRHGPRRDRVGAIEKIASDTFE